MLIQWSEEDHRYLVTLPEWADQYVMPVADGASYEEAAAHGRNALKTYIEFAQEDGKPLPQPRTFTGV